MVEQGYRCTQCGGEQVLVPVEVPVGVVAGGDASDEDAGERRFEREA